MSTTSPDSRAALPGDCLAAAYDAVICDLDGVVYRGPEAVPGAVETLALLDAAGTGVAFATNNASRPPEDVAGHLRELGVPDGDWSVVTSAQAAAAHLAGLLEPGTPVLAVGGPGVPRALAEAGLAPVRLDALDGTTVAAVVQGLGTEVTWRELAEVAHLAGQGVPWVATNLDISLPSARGPVPGNGALVAAVRTATSAVPYVPGKPGAALFDLARTRLGTARERTLVVGDRIDTDVAGAIAAGMDSLLVLSGAATLAELRETPAEQRPTFVAADLTGLARPPVPAVG